jgi:PTS system N-acetylglucosamine-specific IIA component
MAVTAPLSGIAVPLHKVPDPVFAKAIVGPGVAITPSVERQLVLAPISGRLTKLKPHAFVIVGDDGRAVLVHLGIDTVQLNGSDSELIAAEGQRVAAGDPVARWDPQRVMEAGLSPLCPVIALEAAPEVISMVAEGPVAAGADLFTWS